MSEYTSGEPVVDKGYEYTVEQCDVVDKATLTNFREKRRAWLIWLETDEHHAIWQVLHSMVWRDVSFRSIAEVANTNPDSSLHNTLVTESLLTGYFATQVLAIRRLMDRANKDRISLPRLLKDIRRNLRLFTRENAVGFDGLPYDYQAVQHKEMLRQIAQGGEPFWSARSGPDAHIPARSAHEQFDRLTGVCPQHRQRDDRLPKQIINTLDRWLDESGAEELVQWSHTLLAHAAGPNSPNRSAIAAAAPTADKITKCIRSFVRVAEAVTNSILNHSGRGMIVPTPQFNQFERLESPLMLPNGRRAISTYWDKLSEERNEFLNSVTEELLTSTVRPA